MRNWDGMRLSERSYGGDPQPPLFFSPVDDKMAVGLAPAAVALPDATVYFLPSIVANELADSWWQQLQTEIPWRQQAIQMFGRAVMQPRLTAWFGDPGAVYTYSHTRHEPMPWNAPLRSIRAHLQDLCGCTFNAVLANLYRDGADSMGWHSDDEPELGPCPIIASLSLGQARRFVMRHRQDRQRRYELTLNHGSLLVMVGETQRHWQHAVPKTRQPCGPRVNLTFRQINPV